MSISQTIYFDFQRLSWLKTVRMNQELMVVPTTKLVLKMLIKMLAATISPDRSSVAFCKLSSTNPVRLKPNSKTQI